MPRGNVTAKLGLMPKSSLVKDRTRGSEVPLKAFLRKHREFWKTGKTNFALTVALILGNLFLGYAVYQEINAGWKGYKSLRIVLTDTSVFIPIGGFMCSKGKLIDFYRLPLILNLNCDIIIISRWQTCKASLLGDVSAYPLCRG